MNLSIDRRNLAKKWLSALHCQPKRARIPNICTADKELATSIALTDQSLGLKLNLYKNDAGDTTQA